MIIERGNPTNGDQTPISDSVGGAGTSSTCRPWPTRCHFILRYSYLWIYERMCSLCLTCTVFVFTR